jgi:hypothetical protein
MTDTRVRETFGAEEPACCLSHYDLGVVFSLSANELAVVYVEIHST